MLLRNAGLPVCTVATVDMDAVPAFTQINCQLKYRLYANTSFFFRAVFLMPHCAKALVLNTRACRITDAISVRIFFVIFFMLVELLVRISR